MPSRIHDLAKMDTVSLQGFYIALVYDNPGLSLLIAKQAVSDMDRDQIITAIRDIEEPR